MDEAARRRAFREQRAAMAAAVLGLRSPAAAKTEPLKAAAEKPVGGAAARVRAQKRHSEAAIAAAAAALPTPPSGGKAAKKQKLMHSVQLPAKVITPAEKSALAFTADWHDHCETPFEAYRDVEPLLFRLAERLGKTKETLRVYDPYYCEGSMVAHLGRLGFTHVHNVNEDCYKVWAAKRTPAYDVLITNPPYSADHMQRILAFAVASGKPWLLLLPNFVCFKKNFRELVPAEPPVAYLVPAKRYVYYAPGRQTEVTQATSPFDSFWYLSLGEGAESMLAWWERKYARASGAALARSTADLPPLVTPVRDEKRANPKARRRLAKRAAILHTQFGIAHAHIRPPKKRA